MRNAGITHAKFSYLVGTYKYTCTGMYLFKVQSITMITVLFLSQQLFLQNFKVSPEKEKEKKLINCTNIEMFA